MKKTKIPKLFPTCYWDNLTCNESNKDLVKGWTQSRKSNFYYYNTINEFISHGISSIFRFQLIKKSVLFQNMLLIGK